jgi:hypothetical protein
VVSAPRGAQPLSNNNRQPSHKGQNIWKASSEPVVHLTGLLCSVSHVSEFRGRIHMGAGGGGGGRSGLLHAERTDSSELLRFVTSRGTAAETPSCERRNEIHVSTPVSISPSWRHVAASVDPLIYSTNIHRCVHLIPSVQFHTIPSV